MDLTRLGFGGAPSVEIRELAYDARSVQPGSLFFCVKGSTVDGHDLAAEAVAAGAVALVAERQLDVPVPQVIVPSVRAAMGPAAAAFFGDPSHELEVAAVTGTNGKTTTAFLIHAVLEAAGRRPALLTNIERRVGGESRPTGLNTPESIDLQRLFRAMLDAGDHSCAMEATSIAGVQGRLAGTRFAVLVFTNLTQDTSTSTARWRATSTQNEPSSHRRSAPSSTSATNGDGGSPPIFRTLGRSRPTTTSKEFA